VIKKIGLTLLGALVMVLLVAWVVGSAIFFSEPEIAEPVGLARQAASAGPDQTQIYFGDLHVHTSYSMDAAMFGTPMSKGSGYFSPADACDYARFCSAVDFWSINDHAEGLTPEQWANTKESIRQCNAVGGATEEPDTVAFLGWEWSQLGDTPAGHYGHKNVIFRDTAEDLVPRRPISSQDKLYRQMANLPSVVRGLGLLAAGNTRLAAYGSFAAHMQGLNETPDCEAGENTRSLPVNCYEKAETPAELFAKLDQWGFDALVIPHGLAWGTTNLTGADFNNQLQQHNPGYQRLIEVYSGHGNSEIYRDIDRGTTVGAAEPYCPEPQSAFVPCCQQAGQIIRRRCDDPVSEACTIRVAQAIDSYLAADNGTPLNPAKLTIPDASLEDWGRCDQLIDTFMPAFNYQEKQSAQYILSLGDSTEGKPRARLGIIASSDTHSARAGNGYKEHDRFDITDTKDSEGRKPLPAEKMAEALPAEEVSFISALSATDRADGFYYTGGLVATHSPSRKRSDLFDALQRREVYGTSGPRIMLWFDMRDGSGSLHPMGSEVDSAANPVFSVKAIGSRVQLPGCPDLAHQALGEQRLQRLCRGECFNPSDERYLIESIEVVKILPRQSASESTADLIQDPWMVFECPPSQEGCEVGFSDENFAAGGREALYYVRAIQQATDTINGDPFGCDRDARGDCTAVNYCVGKSRADDCLAPAKHRAWSSPIFLGI
jgi:hypothetical protein